MRIVTDLIGKVLLQVKSEDKIIDEKLIENPAYYIHFGKDLLIENKEQKLNLNFDSIDIDENSIEILIEYIRKFDLITMNLPLHFININVQDLEIKSISIGLPKLLFHIMYNICLEVEKTVTINNKIVSLYYLNYNKLYNNLNLTVLKKALFLLDLVPNPEITSNITNYSDILFQEKETIDKYINYNPTKEQNILNRINI